MRKSAGAWGSTNARDARTSANENPSSAAAQNKTEPVTPPAPVFIELAAPATKANADATA